MRKDRAVVRLESHVKRALEECGLTGGPRLVVAVSGGPDSLAMLFSLHRLSAELELRLHGAHLDHALRGASSEQDARSVSETFHRLGIGCTTERVDVAAFRENHHLSLEAAAREVRYRFLARVAAQQRADAVAVGHTADDQAETVLMHIVRGTGLTGLRGMERLARRSLRGNDMVLVRPLLQASREETESYCRALEMEPLLDESNTSVEPTRNRIRLELLPALQQYNPSIKEALLGLSSSAARDADYLDGQAESVLREAARIGPGYVALRRRAFNRLDPALGARVLRRAVGHLKGDVDGLERRHVEDMLKLMSGPVGRTLHLPRGVRFTVGYEEAKLATADGVPPLPAALDGEHRMKVPGETVLPGWRVTATILDGGPEELAELFQRKAQAHSTGTGAERAPAEFEPALRRGPGGLRAVLDLDAVGDELHVRSRRPGDRFQPLGMSSRKKLKDFMVDAKIPRAFRDWVPLVLSPEGIAWVVGWRIADWAKVRDRDRRLLEIEFEEK